jgi:RNA polymerase sigma-70 factor (ECF subfamily)
MERLRAVSLHRRTEVTAGAAEAATSFEEFFERERDRLFGLLVLVTGDRHEAEELAQDAFVSVWERWDRVRGVDNPAGYLHRTAINAFRKRYRRAKAFGRIAASVASKTASGPPDSALLLSEALRALTPRQRAALVLTELLGYTASEAAAALGVKASTIGALKHQGRTALKREAEPEDD